MRNAYRSRYSAEATKVEQQICRVKRKQSMVGADFLFFVFYADHNRFPAFLLRGHETPSEQHARGATSSAVRWRTKTCPGRFRCGVSVQVSTMGQP